VLIFDNAATHTAESLRELLKSIPHIYTPPYRPEFNGIEHLFAWMKRKLV
jgi:transposase